MDILFVKQHERFIGDAFVVLANQAEVDLALSKSRTYLGRRYVEVFRASKLVRNLKHRHQLCLYSRHQSN